MDYRLPVKNSASFAFINQEIGQNRLSHAYLICSNDTKRVEAFAHMTIASVLFGKTDDATVDKIERGGVADVINLPHNESVLTADIKEITDTVYLTPTEFNRKIYLIKSAQTMNESAQNKLLKILEEPPAFVHIILLADSTASFLPTVLSRVKKIELEPLQTQQIVDALLNAGADEQSAYLAGALSGGSLAKAESVITQRQHIEIYNAVIETLKMMKTSRNVLRYSARLMNFSKNINEVIDIMELILADAMKASVGERAGLKFKSGIRDIIEISAVYNYKVVIRYGEIFRRARRRLELNGNVQSVLDELLFSMLEVKAKCLKS